MRGEEGKEEEEKGTWVIVKRILLQFLLIDTTKAILVEKPLETLNHVGLRLHGHTHTKSLTLSTYYRHT